MINASEFLALGRAALEYAIRGWKVFPVAAIGEGLGKADGKTPFAGGPTFKDASCDPKHVEEWWTRNPGANIGLALEPSGLVALDVDSYKDDVGWQSFWAAHGAPSTYKQQSAGGGEHFIFRATPGVAYPGKVQGVPGEIKHKGYILLAPSVARSHGNQGQPGSYKLLSGVDPKPASEWLDGLYTVPSGSRKVDLHTLQARRANRSDDQLLALLRGRQNTFADRESWLNVVFGVHHQFAETEREHEALEALMVWSTRWSGAARRDEHTDDRLRSDALYAWGMAQLNRDVPVTAGTAIMMLNKMPLIISDISKTSLQPHSFTPLPQHGVSRWLFDNHYMLGTISMTVAPGGTGKSLLAIHDALVLASGKAQFGSGLHGPCNVLYMNAGEDDEAMVRKRVDAAMFAYGISDADIGGRLFLKSAPDFATEMGLKDIKMVTIERQSGVTINEAVVSEVTKLLVNNKIDVFIIDPLKHFHLAPENDNDAMNEMATVLADIAKRANCAIELVHHSNKDARIAAGRGGAQGIAQARGASALVDKVRIARSLRLMSKEEADRFGIGDPSSYVSIEKGKANYTSKSNSTRWFFIEGLPLGNGTEEYPDGDTVGILRQFTPEQDTADQQRALKNEILEVLVELPISKRAAS